MPPCSVPPNQPQAPPTGQQAQAVPPCSVPPNQPQAQVQAPPTGLQSAPLPQVFPIGMHNVPLAVGLSGHRPNAQFLYGPLVPQNDEDHLTDFFLNIKKYYTLNIIQVLPALCLESNIIFINCIQCIL